MGFRYDQAAFILVIMESWTRRRCCATLPLSVVGVEVSCHVCGATSHFLLFCRLYPCRGTSFTCCTWFSWQSMLWCGSVCTTLPQRIQDFYPETYPSMIELWKRWAHLNSRLGGVTLLGRWKCKAPQFTLFCATLQFSWRGNFCKGQMKQF